MEFGAELHEMIATVIGDAVQEVEGVLVYQLVLDELTRAGSGVKAVNADDRKSANRRRSGDAGDKAELFCVVGLTHVLGALRIVVLQVVPVVTEAGFVHRVGIRDVYPASADHHDAVMVGVRPIGLQSCSSGEIGGVAEKKCAADIVLIVDVIIEFRNLVVGMAIVGVFSADRRGAVSY